MKFYFQSFLIVSALLLSACNKHQPASKQKKQHNNAEQLAAGWVTVSPSLAVKSQEYGDSGVVITLPIKRLRNTQALSVQWQQTVGVEAIVLNATTENAAVVLPFVREPTRLVFSVVVTEAGERYESDTQLTVLPLSQTLSILNPRLTVDSDVLNITFSPAVAPGSQFAVAVFNQSSGADQAFLPWPATAVTLDGVMLTVPVTLLPSRRTTDEYVQLQLKDAQGQTHRFTVIAPASTAAGSNHYVAEPDLIVSSSSQLAEPVSSAASSVGTITPSSAQIPSSQASASSVSSLGVSSASSENAASSESADMALAQAITSICELADIPPSIQLNVAHVANPFTGAQGYIDGDFVANVEASQQKVMDDTALVAAMEMVKDQPTGVWLDSRAKVCGSPADVSQNFIQHLQAAQAQSVAAGEPVVMTAVIYNLPGRDCVRQARLGELPATEEGMAQYQQFIDQIAGLSSLFPDVRIAAILEPDAFATTVSTGGTIRTLCRSTDAESWYSLGLRFALNRFSEHAQIYSYLDYGDPSWPGSYSGEVALAEFWQSSLLESGESPIDGISLNVAGYIPLEEPFMLAQVQGNDQPYSFEKGLQDVNSYTSYLANYLEQTVGYKPLMLVDTARNGWGGDARRRIAGVGESFRVDRRNGRDSWCNIVAVA